MDDFEHGDSAEEGLVPLFTLSPDSDTAAPHPNAAAGATYEDQRAVFQRHHTFGYDVRLDDDYTPGTYSNDWGYNEGGFKAPSERPRKVIGIAITLVCLMAAGAAVVTQPAARSAVGRFFGGSSDSDPAAVPAPVPTSNVLSLPETGQTDPTPSALPSPAPTDAVPSAAPTPGGQPLETPPADATTNPIFLSASYGQNAKHVGATTCQAGKSSPNACTWQVTVQKGHSLYTKLTWNNPGTLQMLITDSRGAHLFQESNAAGALNSTLDSPPGTVFITVTVTQGTSVVFQLGLADHDFN